MTLILKTISSILITISAFITQIYSNPPEKNFGSVEPKFGALITYQAVWEEAFSSPELLQTTVANHPEIYGNRIQISPTKLLVMKDFQALNNEDALIKIPTMINKFVLLGAGLQLKPTGLFGASRIYNFGQVQKELEKRGIIKIK